MSGKTRGVALLLLSLGGGCLPLEPPSSPNASDQPDTPGAGAPTPDREPPARSPDAWPALEGAATESNDGTYYVVIPPTGDIPLNEDFDVEVRILDGETRLRVVEDVTIEVDARMPAHGHGMKVVPAIEPTRDGRFVAKGMLFHMTGRWELYVDVTRGAVTERAQFVIELE